MRESLLIAALLMLPQAARAQWVAAPPLGDAELRGLSAAAPNVVWASGTRGRYASSIDGGRTWRLDSVPYAGALDFRAVHALDARRAWLMSAGEAEKGQARIYRTTDAGAHWSLVYTTLQKGVFLDALAFWDTQHGIALSDPVGGRLFIVTTNDGGGTWTPVPADRLPVALPGEAAFAASGTCLTIDGESNVWIGTGGGAMARVYHSSDRAAAGDRKGTRLNSSHMSTSYAVFCL